MRLIELTTDNGKVQINTARIETIEELKQYEYVLVTTSRMAYKVKESYTDIMIKIKQEGLFDVH